VFQEEHSDLRELTAMVNKNLLRSIDMDLNGHDLVYVLKEYIL
jgi:hypothetical protein